MDARPPSLFETLADRARAAGPLSAVIVHPCDASAIQSAADAAAAGLIAPILVGPEARIRDAAAAAGVDLGAFRLVGAPHSHAAAQAACALVAAGEAALIMKGSLHTDEIMGAVVAEGSGLRTERRISHAYLIEVPGYPRPLIVTDAAVNIVPDLEAKADIVRNAVDLAKVIGVERPRVALLAAVETVNPRMQATLDAAALCKMADRGQIVGGVLDGPLALDNAVSPQAAAQKGIVSPVAGRADVLLTPDLETGNMVAKILTFMAGARAAGVILGARAPVILTSRADSVETRVASCALAVLLAAARIGSAAGSAGATA